MKPSRVGRRALRGGRHAVRAVARRPMPVAVVGLAAATVLGLGAIAAADPPGYDGFRGHPHHSNSRQFDPRLDPPFDPQSGPHIRPLANWPPPADGADR